MMDRIYRVDASALNLRARPTTSSGVLTTLANGQAVARLDDENHEGWWLVFADIPGDGLFVGFVFSRYLDPVAGQTVPVDDVDPEANGEIDFEDDSEVREPSRYNDVHEEIHSTGPALLQNGWHPDIPDERKFDSPNHSSRYGGATIKRVVLHITGTENKQSVIDNFNRQGYGASAHYLVDKEGRVYQFVQEFNRAWHSGIVSYVKHLYNANDGSWRRFKRYFGWHRGYPADARYFDRNMNPVPKGDSAALVSRADGRAWTDYGYFDSRWGNRAAPIGFFADGGDPNNTSIGIEILSVGGRTADPERYTDRMYESLAWLVDDICARNQIAKTRDFVVGHEDVNPVERWGWDPNQGFEWERVLNTAGLA